MSFHTDEKTADVDAVTSSPSTPPNEITDDVNGHLSELDPKAERRLVRKLDVSEHRKKSTRSNIGFDQC